MGMLETWRGFSGPILAGNGRKPSSSCYVGRSGLFVHFKFAHFLKSCYRQRAAGAIVQAQYGYHVVHTFAQGIGRQVDRAVVREAAYRLVRNGDGRSNGRFAGAPFFKINLDFPAEIAIEQRDQRTGHLPFKVEIDGLFHLNQSRLRKIGRPWPLATAPKATSLRMWRCFWFLRPLGL